MKKSKRCPKCQSGDIVRVPGMAVQGGNNIPAGLTWFNAVKVTRYLCASCGFMGEWLDTAADIAKVKKKYGAASG